MAADPLRVRDALEAALSATGYNVQTSALGVAGRETLLQLVARKGDEGADVLVIICAVDRGQAWKKK